MNENFDNYRPENYPEVRDLLKLAGRFADEEDTEKALRDKILHDPESIILFRDENMDKIIGTIFTVFDPWKSFIYRLGVHPDYRNNGVGTRLLKEAERRLKNKGAHSLVLYVKKDDKESLMYYKKRGWEKRFETYALKLKEL